MRVDGSTGDESQKHSNDVPSKHRVAAVWKSTSILNSLLQTQNGGGIWLAFKKCNNSKFNITSPWKGTAGTGWTLKMIMFDTCILYWSSQGRTQSSLTHEDAVMTVIDGFSLKIFAASIFQKDN